jgi:hypothetical protein
MNSIQLAGKMNEAVSITIKEIVSHPPYPASSLITLRGFLSSRSPTNFECRNLSTYASYRTSPLTLP